MTGARGFLGPYIKEALESTYAVDLSDIDTLDVSDYEKTVEGLRTSAPDIVCHLAGVTGADRSLRCPYEFFMTNCVGTLNVLEACRVNGIGRFVFMSTVTVHGASDETPVDEESPYRPLHPYAGSKAAAEVAVETYTRSYGMRAVILRPTLIAGEGQREPNAVTEFVGSALRDDALRIFGDGRHQREWLHPSDLARAVRAAVDHVVDAPGLMCETYIVSSGVPLGMRELAERVVAAVGKGHLVAAPATRQAFSLCSRPEKAGRVLCWTPKLGIDDIIQRVAAAQSSRGSHGARVP